MSSLISEKELSDLLWKLMKEQGCVNPTTAKRIVMVHEHDVKIVAKKVIDFYKNSVSLDKVD